jgi:tetraacyldisaccharide 4'-kinase
VLERQAVECFILDDGFQHMHLSRDLNVLLLDATDWAGIQALVPIGRLREPLSAAARADALFLTRVDQSTRVEDIWQAVGRACKRLPDPVHLTFKADELVHVATGERKTMDQFKKQTALLFSGIGNPRAFHDLVRRQGVTVSDTVILGDHARYDETVIRGIRHRAQQVNAELWITTEKDAGKIKTLVSQEDPCWAVRLSTAIPGGCDLWERLLGRGIARSQEDNRG